MRNLKNLKTYEKYTEIHEPEEEMITGEELGLDMNTPKGYIKIEDLNTLVDINNINNRGFYISHLIETLKDYGFEILDDIEDKYGYIKLTDFVDYIYGNAMFKSDDKLFVSMKKYKNFTEMQ